MKKTYTITYKGLDSVSGLYETVEAWKVYLNKRFNFKKETLHEDIHNKEASVRLHYYRATIPDSFIVVVKEEKSEITCYKYRNLNETEYFTKDELRFMYENGIRLHPNHMDKTGQALEDWF